MVALVAILTRVSRSMSRSQSELSELWAQVFVKVISQRYRTRRRSVGRSVSRLVVEGRGVRGQTSGMMATTIDMNNDNHGDDVADCWKKEENMIPGAD